VGNHRDCDYDHYQSKQNRKHPAGNPSQCRESQRQEDDYQEEMHGANADLMRLHDAGDIPVSLATLRTAFPAANSCLAFSTLAAGIGGRFAAQGRQPTICPRHSTPARRVQLREIHL
jgi:hypothetical protein